MIWFILRKRVVSTLTFYCFHCSYPIVTESLVTGQEKNWLLHLSHGPLSQTFDFFQSKVKRLSRSIVSCSYKALLAEKKMAAPSHEPLFFEKIFSLSSSLLIPCSPIKKKKEGRLSRSVNTFLLKSSLYLCFSNSLYWKKFLPNILILPPTKKTKNTL